MSFYTKVAAAGVAASLAMGASSWGQPAYLAVPACGVGSAPSDPQRLLAQAEPGAQPAAEEEYTDVEVEVIEAAGGVRVPIPPAPDEYEALAFVPGGTAVDALYVPTAFTMSNNALILTVAGAKLREDPTTGAGGGYDAVVALSYGLGHPQRGVQFDAVLGDVSGLTTPSFNVKYMLRDEDVDQPAIAVGVLNIFDNTTNFEFYGRSWYIVGTKTFWDNQRLAAQNPFFGRTTFSLGWGVGEAFNNGPIGSLSTSVSSRSTFILDYNGRGFDAGFSIQPSRKRPWLLVDLGVQDVFDGTNRTFGAAVTIPLHTPR